MKDILEKMEEERLKTAIAAYHLGLELQKNANKSQRGDCQCDENFEKEEINNDNN